MGAVREVACGVCGASQSPTADCMGCGHPLLDPDGGASGAVGAVGAVGGEWVS